MSSGIYTFCFGNLIKENLPLICGSTRVSNELGAGVNRAKNAMTVTLKLAVILALLVVLPLAFGHNIWPGFFSKIPELKKDFAPMKYFLIISLILDVMQAVLSGLSKIVYAYQRICYVNVF